MSVKQFAAQMKASIEELKTEGVSNLSCDSIIAYLNDVESSASAESSAMDIEHYKANLQNIADSNRQRHEIKLEKWRKVVEAGQNAIKSSFLLNGGAVIALLAFITHLAQSKGEKVSEFADCLLPFVMGVFVVAMTPGFLYVSQWLHFKYTPQASKWAFRIGLVGTIIGFTSYIFFAWGMFFTYWAFKTYTA